MSGRGALSPDPNLTARYSLLLPTATTQLCPPPSYTTQLYVALEQAGPCKGWGAHMALDLKDMNAACYCPLLKDSYIACYCPLSQVAHASPQLIMLTSMSGWGVIGSLVTLQPDTPLPQLEAPPPLRSLPSRPPPPPFESLHQQPRPVCRSCSRHCSGRCRGCSAALGRGGDAAAKVEDKVRWVGAHAALAAPHTPC